MNAFERSEAYINKITLDALDRDIHLDATIRMEYLGRKLKARCKETNTYVQFPRHLRTMGATFIADVIKMSNGGKIFYRAYKGSIRNIRGEVVA